MLRQSKSSLGIVGKNALQSTLSETAPIHGALQPLLDGLQNMDRCRNLGEILINPTFTVIEGKNVVGEERHDHVPHIFLVQNRCAHHGLHLLHALYRRICTRFAQLSAIFHVIFHYHQYKPRCRRSHELQIGCLILSSPKLRSPQSLFKRIVHTKIGRLEKINLKPKPETFNHSKRIAYEVEAPQLSTTNVLSVNVKLNHFPGLSIST